MQIPLSINCKGRMLSLAKPIVMGIVNATPDSFFNKGQENSLSELLLLTEKMLTAIGFECRGGVKNNLGVMLICKSYNGFQNKNISVKKNIT